MKLEGLALLPYNVQKLYIEKILQLFWEFSKKQ